jgi:O-antigen biosynthesis protein
MKISVIIPTNNPKYIRETIQSLLDQTHKDWEAIVLMNDFENISMDEIDYMYQLEKTDSRIKINDQYLGVKQMKIGFLKRTACMLSSGNVIVELDHDDMLTRNALEKICNVFENENVDFAYSDFAEFFDGTNKPRKYGSSYGWKYRTEKYNGVEYECASAFPIAPPYITNITHAPNHVRAWRTSFYKSFGGHDPNLEVADDFSLVVKTFLKARQIVHIKEMLYLYRIHYENTSSIKIKEVSRIVSEIYENNAEDIMKKWCEIKSLESCVIDHDFNFEAFFNHKQKESSFGLIKCSDCLGRMRPDKKVEFFNKIWLSLAPGGAIFIDNVSSNGEGSNIDPNAISYWNKNSFWPFTRKDHFSKYVKNSVSSFFERTCYEYYPNDFCKENNILYLRVHLYKPYKQKLNEIGITKDVKAEVSLHNTGPSDYLKDTGEELIFQQESLVDFLPEEPDHEGEPKNRGVEILPMEFGKHEIPMPFTYIMKENNEEVKE